MHVSENNCPQRIVTSVKTKCCRSCSGLWENLDEMTFEIETLESPTDSLQAYVNIDEPSSSLDVLTALVKNLELHADCIYERKK
jgi:hypothetical protein